MIKRAAIAIITIVIALTVYHPGRHAKHYDYVVDEEVLRELVPRKGPPSGTNLKRCPYEDVVVSSDYVDTTGAPETHRFRPPLEGGEYRPDNCRALFKTAIIVPYRNRKEHLDKFSRYMHSFLQKQFVHYKIFIVEQNNTKPFNRAKMFNYGAVEAMKQEFDCLILHDVDLLPLTSGNVYACSKFPRHMSSSLDTFRFNLPYLGLFGGVISIQSEQFKRVNGMSNMYDGWGGEDDDMFTRLEAYDLLPYRFSPSLSRYTMLQHKKETPSDDRFQKLQYSLERQRVDGLNSLKKDYSVRSEPLFTHIFVP